MDGNDISPEMAADLMFAEERGLEMESCADYFPVKSGYSYVR